jgi:protein-arginine kinase activator protein McsA
MDIINYDYYSCLMCGMKPDDFLKEFKLGCPFCYLFMENFIKKVTKSVQDENLKHLGKINKNNLLHKFLKKNIDDMAKKYPEKSQECKELKKLIREYF